MKHQKHPKLAFQVQTFTEHVQKKKRKEEKIEEWWIYDFSCNSIQFIRQVGKQIPK